MKQILLITIILCIAIQCTGQSINKGANNRIAVQEVNATPFEPRVSDSQTLYRLTNPAPVFLLPQDAPIGTIFRVRFEHDSYATGVIQTNSLGEFVSYYNFQLDSSFQVNQMTTVPTFIVWEITKVTPTEWATNIYIK